MTEKLDVLHSMEKQRFFEARARILAELEGMERTEAVFLLASAINEHLAPVGYGATVTTRCLVSDGDENLNHLNP